MNNSKSIDRNDLFFHEKLEELERQIKEKQKITDHEIREFPISVIVDKFTKGREDDTAELFIPDYQREFIWTEKQQSKFIESLLLNLPIPYLFVADTNQFNDGRLEIVDGSQRIRTLDNFMSGNLKLSGLEKLPAANTLTYNDFPASRQLRFGRKTLRMIELTEYADEEARREIFDRLNSGGTALNSMERRYGSKDHPFYIFLRGMVKKYTGSRSLFRKICPISETRRRRAEHDEMLMRYFAYSDSYLNFDHRVDEFLESFADQSNHDFPQMEHEFEAMLHYVNKTFPLGFRRAEIDNSVPRIRFEAIAVGVTLALRKNPSLSTTQSLNWLESEEFKTHTRSDASNSKRKVKERIEFVRDQLLKNK